MNKSTKTNEPVDNDSVKNAASITLFSERRVLRFDSFVFSGLERSLSGSLASKQKLEENTEPQVGRKTEIDNVEGHGWCTVEIGKGFFETSFSLDVQR